MKRFGICAAIVAATLMLSAAPAMAGDRRHGGHRSHHRSHSRHHGGYGVSVGVGGVGVSYGHGYYSQPRQSHYDRHSNPSYGSGYYVPSYSYGNGSCW